MANTIDKSNKRLYGSGRRVGPPNSNALRFSNFSNKKMKNLPALRGDKISEGCNCSGIDCWQIADLSNPNVCDFVVS